VKLSEWDIRLQNSRLEREEKRRAQEEHERYQDQVIHRWLREKADEENKRLRRQQRLKLKEKKRMEHDRQRIVELEEELAKTDERSENMKEHALKDNVSPEGAPVQ